VSSPQATSGPDRGGLIIASSGQAASGERFLRELAYVAAGLPLGVLYLLVICGGLLGAALGVLWVGVPLMLAASVLLWRGAALERQLANRLLDAQISALPPLAGSRSGAAWPRVRRRFGGRAFWRAMGLLVLRLPVSAAAGALIAGTLFVSAALVVLGIRALSGAETGYVGPLALNPGLGLLMCVLAVPVAVLAVTLTDGLAAGLRALTRSLLVTSLPAGTPVRETLAQSLGDRTLSIAYWLPDRQVFVDERGHPVPLPEPGADRAWTAVDYEGQRVAAIIHDASLEATPELVQAAAAAASLALDNERLKADLRARVEELRASRVRIVEASNVARRKLERDLHDGAQQQLVALAIDLKLLRARLGGNQEAGEMIDQIEAKLSTALDELRELARGIHPGILTDRGLAPALQSLASRAPVGVACEFDLPGRPPPSVEAVAYFVAAEALTNVLKYAEAGQVVIRARLENDDLVVEIQDDGVGGADERKGTGLQGLRDRVGALDGTLTVISPPAGGTLVRAQIPCRAGALVADARAEGRRYG
jgi:signal transduction histidine kinase